MNGMKKGLLFLMLPVALSLALAGCFPRPPMCRPPPRPCRSSPACPARRTLRAAMMPGSTPMPGSTMSPGQQFDWATQATTIESRIFCSPKSRRAASCSCTALVGVVIPPQYKGGDDSPSAT